MVPQTRVFTGGGERHLQQRYLWTTVGTPPTAMSSQGQPHCGSSTSSANPWAASLPSCLQAEFQRQQKEKKSCVLRVLGREGLVTRVLLSQNSRFVCHGGDFPDSHGTAAAAAKSLQSCPTLCDPHRRQPTRLPRPWDSPGKNTGVGCHFLLQCMNMKSEK